VYIPEITTQRDRDNSEHLASRTEASVWIVKATRAIFLSQASAVRTFLRELGKHGLVPFCNLTPIVVRRVSITVGVSLSNICARWKM
jgi:hypothetical protein